MKKLTLNTLNARMDAIESKLDNLIEALNRKPASGRGNTQPTVEKTVKYTKADGTTVMCTPAQAKAWDAWKANADTRKDNQAKFEQMKADWSNARDAYKPSKALIKAIKSDRASVTLAVAKTHGFVGTKNDLKALKDSLCK